MSNTDPIEKESREVLSVKISKEAAEGWRQFCAENGITITAFVEIAGRDLASETSPPTVEARADIVKRARKVDLERRSRKPN